jgi:enoyl-CoA hydratase/carnithine racemase
MSDGFSATVRDAGVLELRLERPERMNALGVDMLRGLITAVELAAADRTRVIVVKGSGRAFCAGADLKERRSMSLPERTEHNRLINEFVDAVAASPAIAIAAINGAALGGGCELAMACDLRVAAAGAMIGLTEARVGAIPGAGGTQRLPRLVGHARALELILTGEPIPAERAETIGLVNAVVTAEELEAHVARLAALIASRSPNGLRTVKQLVYGGAALPLSEGLKLERQALAGVFASADYAEGLVAFAEKRPPRFGEVSVS